MRALALVTVYLLSVVIAVLFIMWCIRHFDAAAQLGIIVIAATLPINLHKSLNES